MVPVNLFEEREERRYDHKNYRVHWVNNWGRRETKLIDYDMCLTNKDNFFVFLHEEF